ncbi:hypothetical protein N9937_02270 [bacterium]|nr:hypothetical protein [bacterium]
MNKPMWHRVGPNRFYGIKTLGRRPLIRICDARPWYDGFSYWNGRNTSGTEYTRAGAWTTA